MKFAHNVLVSVFVQPHEDVSEWITKLLSLVTFGDKDKPKLKSTVAAGFSGKLTIIELVLDKDRHIRQIVESLVVKLSEQDISDLVRGLDRIDDQLHFYVRLDKSQFAAGNFKLTESGDCVHFNFSLAAYPKRREVGFGLVERAFSQSLNNQD